MTRLERDICSFAGRIINPRSNDQLRDYFFKEKSYTPRTLTKGGKSGVRQASVDDKVLEYLEEQGDQLAAMVRNYRELGKYDSDYVRGLQSRMDHRDRVHTRFNQDVARTGRLSSKNPNLQNIKRPDEDKYKIRGAFIPEDGNEHIVADYEQLEMRLLAAASMEPKMIDVFMRKWDIHMGNAALVFGRKYNISYDDINAAKKIDKKVKSGELPESAMTDRVKLCLFLRQAAKAIGFGLNYGMKENKLARNIGVTPDEAKELIEQYMATYPAVGQFYEEAIDRAWKYGYSFTLLGKRRFLPEIKSRNKMDAWQAEANAAALAMIHIHRENLKKHYGCRMLLQVHDELVFECPKDAVAEVMPIIRERMEHPFKTDLAVPLDVSIGRGPNWMDAK
jgi:DNA polymerase-1